MALHGLRQGHAWSPVCAFTNCHTSGHPLLPQLEAVRQEKAEVTTKLTALRSDVRTTMDEVTRDRWAV